MVKFASSTSRQSVASCVLNSTLHGQVALKNDRGDTEHLSASISYGACASHATVYTPKHLKCIEGGQSQVIPHAHPKAVVPITSSVNGANVLEMSNAASAQQEMSEHVHHLNV